MHACPYKFTNAYSALITCTCAHIHTVTPPHSHANTHACLLAHKCTPAHSFTHSFSHVQTLTQAHHHSPQEQTRADLRPRHRECGNWMELRPPGSHFTSNRGPPTTQGFTTRSANLLHDRTQYLMSTFRVTSKMRPVSVHWYVPSPSAFSLHGTEENAAESEPALSSMMNSLAP